MEMPVGDCCRRVPCWRWRCEACRARVIVGRHVVVRENENQTSGGGLLDRVHSAQVSNGETAFEKRMPKRVRIAKRPLHRAELSAAGSTGDAEWSGCPRRRRGDSTGATGLAELDENGWVAEDEAGDFAVTATRRPRRRHALGCGVGEVA